MVVAVASFIVSDVISYSTTYGNILNVVVQALVFALAIAILPIRAPSRAVALALVAAALLVTGFYDANVNGISQSYGFAPGQVHVLEFFFLGVLSPCLGLAAWLVARERVRLVFLIGLPVAVVVNSVLLLGIYPAIESAVYANSYTATTGAVIALNIGIDLLEILAWIGITLLTGFLDGAIRRARPAGPVTSPMLVPAPMNGSVPSAVTATHPGQARTSTIAILALVFGIIGSGVVAVVLGHVALSQIRRTGEQGRGMAIAGLVLGYVTTAALIALLIFYAVLLAGLSSSSPFGY